MSLNLKTVVCRTVLGFCLLALIASCGNVTYTPNNTINFNIAMPVLDKTMLASITRGDNPQMSIHIYNITDQVISGIKYELVENGSDFKNSSALRFDSNVCTTIAANSSCSFMFLTPHLDCESDLGIFVNFNNGVESMQLVNYDSYNSNDYTLEVSF